MNYNEAHIDPISSWITYWLQRNVASESSRAKKDPSILKPTVVTIWDTIVTPSAYLVDTVSVPTEGDSSVIENDTVRIVITKYQDKMIVKTRSQGGAIPCKRTGGVSTTTCSA
jgi:hypothetical protein